MVMVRRRRYRVAYSISDRWLVWVFCYRSCYVRLFSDEGQKSPHNPRGQNKHNRKTRGSYTVLCNSMRVPLISHLKATDSNFRLANAGNCPQRIGTSNICIRRADSRTEIDGDHLVLAVFKKAT